MSQVNLVWIPKDYMRKAPENEPNK